MDQTSFLFLFLSSSMGYPPGSSFLFLSSLIMLEVLSNFSFVGSLMEETSTPGGRGF